MCAEHGWSPTGKKKRVKNSSSPKELFAALYAAIVVDWRQASLAIQSESSDQPHISCTILFGGVKQEEEVHPQVSAKSIRRSIH